MGVSVTEVQKALKGADYPATREELVRTAEGNGASGDVVQALRDAGAERFDGPDQVMKAMKGSLGG
jgi:hypothetical protein